MPSPAATSGEGGHQQPAGGRQPGRVRILDDLPDLDLGCAREDDPGTDCQRDRHGGQPEVGAPARTDDRHEGRQQREHRLPLCGGVGLDAGTHGQNGHRQRRNDRVAERARDRCLTSRGGRRNEPLGLVEDAPGERQREDGERDERGREPVDKGLSDPGIGPAALLDRGLPDDGDHADRHDHREHNRHPPAQPAQRGCGEGGDHRGRRRHEDETGEESDHEDEAAGRLEVVPDRLDPPPREETRGGEQGEGRCLARPRSQMASGISTPPEIAWYHPRSRNGSGSVEGGGFRVTNQASPAR